MAISTVNQKGLDAPLTLTSPVLNSPAFSGTPTGTLVSANMPTGSVLQVVNATYGTAVSSSTNTYVDTNLTASITPKFATSKILVIANINGLSKYTNNTSVGLRLVRNSTSILNFEGVAGYNTTTTTIGVGGSSCNYLDSPATTSATTYKIQFCSSNNLAIVYVNDTFIGSSPSTSTITLMEIAG